MAVVEWEFNFGLRMSTLACLLLNYSFAELVKCWVCYISKLAFCIVLETLAVPNWPFPVGPGKLVVGRFR